MKKRIAQFGFILSILLSAAMATSLAYLKYDRPVQPGVAGQNYIAMDEVIWKHARPDLGDLRLYSGDVETPYALLVERGSSEHELRQLRVLQQASVGGKTQFLLDMQGVTEYDHVELRLASRNFIAHARVEGEDDPHGANWALLSDNIIYEFSKENLGGSSMLRLPRATFRYLRVTIDGPVKPDEVQGASSEMREEAQPVWRQVNSTPEQKQDGKDTVFTFAVPEHVPVEKVVFAVDPEQPNFRRQVEILNDQKQHIGSGEISRIHLVRFGNKVDSENFEVAFSAPGEKKLSVVIHNGDDAPLRLQSARLEQQERRLYFEAAATNPLTLYYGDEKLAAPVYDYAKLFQREKTAAAATLGAEQENRAYTGRPDERPWTERHPVLLWIAIIVAVLVLGAVALRSMKTATA
ncbi:MAG TPA: DUF3999 family protein [Candidatus Limnocylindrales bacterium]|nr:DUF3999 family protein [Candidatus Limnocylindrales bacterium]